MPAPATLLPQIYLAPTLDRAAHRRRDDAWLAARRADPASRIVRLFELKVPLLERGARGAQATPAGEALARHARSSASRALSIGSQSVQLVALLFAALALLGLGASWLLTYSAALTAGA